MGNQKRGFLSYLFIPILFLLSISLVIPSVFSEEASYPLSDAITKQPLYGLHIIVRYGDNEISTISWEGLLKVDVPAGTETEIMGDNASTLGKDYYARKKMGEGVIYLMPTGTIIGIVKDKLDNIVGDSDLKFTCSNYIWYEPPEKTDRFGSFSVDYVPVGRCRIFAQYGDAMGFEEVTINPGDLVEVEIKLNNSIISDGSGAYPYSTLLIALLVFILAISFVIGFRRYRSRYMSRAQDHKAKGRTDIHESRSGMRTASISLKSKKGREKAKDSQNPKRSDDILKTLNENERSFVKYLLQNKNKSMQSNMRHALGIPRTTLSRIVESLERKDIIKVERFGKAVKIELTGWFLGKK